MTIDITLSKGITNHGIVGHDGPVYTDVMVRDIVRAAVEANRKQRFGNGDALQRYKECGGDGESDPLERLRFYCSLAMSGQDWLDVEPFFDALVADRQSRMPSDAEILACLRPLYSNDVAAAMGAADDLRTAHLLLSHFGSGQPAASAIPVPTTKAEYIALLDLAVELGKKLNIAWEDAFRAAGGQPPRQQPAASTGAPGHRKLREFYDVLTDDELIAAQRRGEYWGH